MNSNTNTKDMALAGLVAALYTVVSLVLAPVSYGAVQFRLSEALTLLAVFSPTMVVGVTLGCGVSNLLGFLLGYNLIILDVVFGTLATGIAGVLSYKLRGFRLKGYPYLSVLPPVLINAIVIGAEITFLSTINIFSVPKVLAINMAYIGLSQIIPCMVLGPILIIVLEKTKIADRYLLEDN